jgi:hypothetical protein
MNGIISLDLPIARQKQNINFVLTFYFRLLPFVPFLQQHFSLSLWLFGLIKTLLFAERNDMFGNKGKCF